MVIDAPLLSDSSPVGAPVEIPMPLRQRRRRVPWNAVILLLLTAFAAFIRFYWIVRPPLWGDEAYTYSRTGGDFRDLLDILQMDGFVPLHYALYWVIVQLCRLDLADWRRKLIVVGPAIVVGVVAWPVIYLTLRKWWTRWTAAGAGLVLAVGAALGLAALLRPFSQITFVSPLVMRFIPALAGTLMVPAMYFVAAQIAGKKIGLLTAALTACSAYMMVYSHDAKMYMHAWLFNATSVGCLIWWIRTRKRIAWLAWLACGLAAVGTHASTMVMPVVEFLFVLSCTCGWRRPWLNVKRLALFLLGAGVILAGPIGYYAGFNRWAEHVDEAGWEVSGVNWVQAYNQNRTGPDLLLYASTAHLFSWEWPEPDRRAQMDVYVRNALTVATMIIFALAFVGAVQWRKKRRSGLPLPALRGRAGEGVDEDGRDLHATPSLTLPRSTGGGDRSGGRGDKTHQPWWRQLFWIAAWLVLPAYGFYCRSMDHFASPAEWLREAKPIFTDKGWWIVGECIVGIGLYIAVRISKAARWMVGGAVALTAIVFVYDMHLFRPTWETSPAHRWWQWVGSWPPLVGGHAALIAFAVVMLAIVWWRGGSDWRVRTSRFLKAVGLLLAVIIVYWAAIVQAGDFEQDWQSSVSRWPLIAKDNGVLATLLICGLLISFWNCGPTIARRFWRAGQFVLVVAVLLAGCWGVYGAMQYAWESQVKSIMADHSTGRVGGAWESSLEAARADHGVPPLGMARHQAQREFPSESTAQIDARARAQLGEAEKHWDELVARNQSAGQDKKTAEDHAAQRIAAEKIEWRLKWESMWMPRYIGVIWPAVTIGLALLLMRLPLRSMRWAAIALVLLINLGQAYGRLFAGSEPPMDAIMHDIAQAQTEDADGKPIHSDTITMASLQYSMGGHPGSMTTYSPAARFYGMVERQHWVVTPDFRNFGGPNFFAEKLNMKVRGMNISDLRYDLAHRPEVRHVILWMMGDEARQHIPQVERVLTPEQWKLASDTEYAGRMHWWWANLYTVRRVEFNKR